MILQRSRPPSSLPPSLSFPRLGGAPCKELSKLSPQKLSGIVGIVRRFCPPGVLLSVLFPGNGVKIFSNRWKTGEKFFQSLEKTGGFFQPLENFFPTIGKPFRPRGPPDCAKPGARKRLCPSQAAGGKHGARGGRRHGGCREGASRPRQHLFRSLALVEEFGARGFALPMFGGIV